MRLPAAAPQKPPQDEAGANLCPQREQIGDGQRQPKSFFALDGAVANKIRRIPPLRKLCRTALLMPRYFGQGALGVGSCVDARVTYWLRHRIGYTREYYVGMIDNPEVQSWHRNIIRPPDMGAAICYALGATSWEQVCQILGCDDSITLPRGKTSAAEQAGIIANAGLGRKPNLVYDIGCGRGEVAATLVHMGICAVAVDPSHATGALVDETASRLYGLSSMSVPFKRATCLEALRKSVQTPDTIIFCESVEHIPMKELVAVFELIQNRAEGMHGEMRVIVTNWPTYHPIRAPPGDWNHVHDVDDELYDRLASRARKTVVRRGSHLVLQF